MSCDRFIRHPCIQCTISAIRWIPVLFITAVICWSYYAYVYELCIKSVPYPAQKAMYLILYHAFLGIFLWAYYQCIFTPIGRVPKQFIIPNDVYQRIEYAMPSQQRQILDSFAKDLPVLNRTFDGCIRFCEKCKAVKPDRAHHCSICGFCVLKMDHHCPWVNTCVGFSNYKFFLLFLGYALVYCLYVALSDLPYFIRFWSNELNDDSFGKFHVMFLFFVGGMFAISVSILFIYHMWLVCKNRSTLESFRAPVFRTGPDKNGFSLGCRANFQEIFGDRKMIWFLPVFSSLGDGVRFPSRYGGDQGCSYGTTELKPPQKQSFHSPPSPAIQPYHFSYSNSTTKAPLANIENIGNVSKSSQSSCLGQDPSKVGSKSDGTTEMQRKEAYSMGDGVSYPVRTFDMECDGLLVDRQSWIQDEESGSESDRNSAQDLSTRFAPNGNAIQMQSIIVH